MTITSDIQYIGVDDHMIDLFEGMYVVPNGMSYNSYVICDEKIAVMDTVDAGFTIPWLNKLQNLLKERKPDYLIVQHMEPDHSANVLNFMEKYPGAMVVASAKAFAMMRDFLGTEFQEKRLVVDDGDILSLGRHKLKFVTAPMVHWPEVIMTYDSTEGVLFSADGFGKFGALDVKDEWEEEARRYYTGIIAKYGVQVQSLLKKLSGLDIQKICPLHGPVLSESIGNYIQRYHTWSCYEPEEEGIVIAYTSIYGNTKKAAQLLEHTLKEKGYEKVVVRDLARCDITKVAAEAFRYSTLVLATTTYNAEIFPFMREFIQYLVERNFKKRKIAFIENGSWAPIAARLMGEYFGNNRDLVFANTVVRIKSSLKEESVKQIELLAEELSCGEAE